MKQLLDMVQFRMIGIEVPQYAILADKCPDSHENMQVNAQVAFAADAPHHVVACKMRFVFKDSENALEAIEIICAFEVANEDWNKFSDGTKIIIPQSFLTHIAFHTVGTARGVLYTKSEKTPFSRIILPPINVEEMVKSNMVVE